MRKRTKTLAGIGFFVILIVGLPWAAINFQRGIVSAYYEWGVTCIIASYAEDHDGMPPSNWADLVGYEYHTQYLPEPRTMESAARHVSVDFDSLLAYKTKRISELPSDIVCPKRGFEQHWIDPKWTLERYFRDGELPHGSFDANRADELRYYAEGGE